MNKLCYRLKQKRAKVATNLIAKEMQAMKDIICGLSAYGIIPTFHQKAQQAKDDQARRRLICGLPANGIIPQLQQQTRQEADDDQGIDVEELTERQYRRAMGYFIRIEEDEEDIEPMYRAINKMRNNARNSTQLRRPKQEQGESSRGKSRRQN